MTERLPELLDAKRLRGELCVTRAAAEAIMRQLPSVQIEGLRKVYVRRGDVQRLIDTRTFGKDEVPGSKMGATSQMGGHRVNGPAPAPGNEVLMRNDPNEAPLRG